MRRVSAASLSAAVSVTLAQGILATSGGRRTPRLAQSIAAYHSDTPQFADEYQRRVLAMWQEHKVTRLHVDSGLIYGAFGSTGRVYGVILPGDK
jgi:hypothetical protein